MHYKAIKKQINKQLKKEYPDWHRLTKKEKKAGARKVLDEVAETCDFKQESEFIVPELLGMAN